eukprot:3009556-Amphidinium_carterae.1
MEASMCILQKTAMAFLIAVALGVGHGAAVTIKNLSYVSASFRLGKGILGRMSLPEVEGIDKIQRTVPQSAW